MNTLDLARDGDVAVLTLNRPQALNAVNKEMLTEFDGALRRIDNDQAVRALVITGAGRGFCAGADLTEELAGDEGAVAELLDKHYNRIVRALVQLRKPVLSAINGVAAGGGVGLGLAADVVFAARSARFVQVFGPQLAIVPDVGSTWHLPRLIGRARALPLMMSGEPLAAETASDWGLIWKCVDDDKLMDETMAMARTLAAGPTDTLVEIRKAAGKAATNSLNDQLDLERDLNGMLCARPNFREGVAAFREKRKPRFE